MRWPHGRIAKLSSKSSKKNEQPLAPLVPLGRLVNTHGVRGELRFLPYSFPCQTLYPGLTIFLQDNEDGQPHSYTVERARPRAPFVLVKLVGVDSLDHAETLREKVVAIEETDLPSLREGEFYYYQVVGLAVRTTKGMEVGKITHVFFSGGHDVWVVRHGKKEYLIPVTEEIVRSIDLSRKEAIIEPLAGLLE